jgi:hypothetical protein
MTDVIVDKCDGKWDGFFGVGWERGVLAGDVYCTASLTCMHSSEK